MLNYYCKSPDAQHIQLIQNANTSLSAHCEWKIQFLASFENWIRPLKSVAEMCCSSIAEIKLYAITARQFPKWAWGFICISWCWKRLIQWKQQIAMNSLTSMISFDGFAFVAEHVVLIRLKRATIECIVFTNLACVECTFAIWRGV